MSQYSIGDNSNPKHNITKSMVGPLPLAPHHDYLQYMYHVYLMQTGSKLRFYILHAQHKEGQMFLRSTIT